MKVIINADDFGLTSGGNRAIIECHKNGVLTSTTLMATTKYTQEAIQLAKENPSLGVGVHMVLTTGRPILDSHKTLVDETGKFKYTINTIDDAIDHEELFAEWDAQIESIKQHLDITHLDSHHHVHMHPKINDVVVRLAKKHNVPYRSERLNLPTEVLVDGAFYKEGVSLDYFKELFESDKAACVDVMTHPAYVDDYLESISSYTSWRQVELEILTSQALKDLVNKHNIELITYRDITA
ncbi:chitin disaccharide deacetylase [Erysipelothrix sp. HDW6B]|uniref:chitin disaccharide deacetylase n=1 Tax=Erysipelothrix TaxID=1647 RepID=UPI0013584F92|nr:MULTISPECIES: chitin disaccharide deacetylase [Erysipelothrix]QIK85921.1 chitin disaccharide deacetylase [Erysipelothrix sp. HDW6B]